MSSGAHEASIVGTDGNDFITVERSVSFVWVPAASNASVVEYYNDYWENRQLYYPTTGPGTASGMVTFPGASSGKPFQIGTRDVGFRFTDSNAFLPWDTSETYSLWSYDPATGVLDPDMGISDWDGLDSAWFGPNVVSFQRVDKNGAGNSDTEYGHWQLLPEIHNVDVFGGDGTDTIHGGQGSETLDGGDGDDVIRASVGNDLILGDAGNDRLHAGTGRQTLMGGTGNDVLWGGTGSQMLLGDAGNDIIHGGSGRQTLIGGAGDDTVWGGAGIQFLEGDSGNDILSAGSGNETLSGGAGRDTFVFSAAAIGHDVITDFHPGEDIVRIDAHFGPPQFSADARGDAVLAAGDAFRLVLQNVAAQRVELHPADFFKLF